MRSAATDTNTTVEQVWRDFGAQLRTFVRKRVSDRDRADDVVSDVLLRVHRNLHTVNDPERLPAWLYQVARNAITDEYRRHARRDVPQDFTVMELVDDRSTDVAIDDQEAVLRELASCMRPLVRSLDDHYRRAIELTDLDGLTQAEAAQREGISVSGMKSRVQRGRKQLGELLSRCCALSLDARGMPVEYAAPGGCSCE